jgi:Tol biopolymer transport system component
MPEWSTDGEWILYAKTIGSNRGLWIMKPDGSGKKHIFDYGRSSPTWHPNSINFFNFAGPFLDDYILKFHPFTAMKPDTIESIKNADNRYPKISPDGSKMAFVSNTKEQNIILMDLNSTNKVILTNGDQPVWSPDGSKIAFKRYSPAGGLGTIWIIDSDGNNPRQLTFLPQSVLDSLTVYGYLGK